MKILLLFQDGYFVHVHLPLQYRDNYKHFGLNLIQLFSTDAAVQMEYVLYPVVYPEGMEAFLR